jgi:quercetin dioxygenase-like cupin family protein
MSSRSFLAAGLLLLVLFAAGAPFARERSGGRPPGLRFLPDQIPWKPAASTLPAGTRVALLEGDPNQTGLVTLRLRVGPGFRLPPHTHPADERVTVLSGAVRVGFGDVVDDAARTESVLHPAGSFYVNPRGVPHFVEADEETVLQITVEGPWRVDPVGVPAR